MHLGWEYGGKGGGGEIQVRFMSGGASSELYCT